MHNVKTSIMTLPMRDHADSAHVTSTSDHCNHTSVKSNEVGDFAILETDLDCVIDFDSWVWVSDPDVINPSAYWAGIRPKLDPTTDR